MEIFHDWEPVALVGRGWYDKEKSLKGELFRWVGDGAWLDIAQLGGLAYNVTLEIEPGPAVGLKPFDLKLYEDGKRPFAGLHISGREKAAFLLPPGDPAVHHIELRVENTSPAVEAPGDPRTLQFRIFSIAIAPAPDLSHLESQISDLSNELATQKERLQKLQDEATRERDQMVASVAQLEREVASREAIIQRSEQTIAQLRAEIEELRRNGELQNAEIEFQVALSQERLEVIRALHEQGQRAIT